MQVGHELGEVAMGFDQPIVHVARMAGGIAQARKALDIGQPVEEVAEAPFIAIRAETVPGVDILAEQRDLAHPPFDETLGLRDDL